MLQILDLSFKGFFLGFGANLDHLDHLHHLDHQTNLTNLTN